MIDTLRWIRYVVYAITFPCLFVHIGVIVSIIVFKKFRTPINYLVASLSYGAVLHQIGVLIIPFEYYFTFWESTTSCAIRSVTIRVGHGVVTFTLVKLIRERNYMARNPGYNPTMRKVFTSIVFITLASIMINTPLGFSREYNPDLETKYKCAQVILLGSVGIEWTYRFIRFVVAGLIPALSLFQELRKMLKFMKAMRLEDDPGNQAYQRIKFMRTSCIFIFFFIFFSVPYTALDTLDTAALPLSLSMKQYHTSIRMSVYFCSYILVTTYPVYMYYVNRYRFH